MFIQFITVFIPTFFALVFFEFFKEWVTKPVRLFGFVKPKRAVWYDLNKYCENVNKQLDKDFKVECLPINIDLLPVSNTWASHKDAKEIISGLLEKVGWVVIPTENPNIIRLDVPRVKAPQETKPT